MTEQRPSRVRGQPARFHDEQASLHALAHAAAAESFPRLHVLADALPDSDSESEEEEEEKRGEGSAAVAEQNTWDTVYAAAPPRAFVPPHHDPPLPRHCTSPLDFFQLFCPHSFLELIAAYTNAYAEEKHAARKENAAPNSPAEEWAATDAREVAAMLGCLLYMGMVSMNDTKDYWAADTRQPFVADAFPRDRFLALLWNLRFNEQAELEAAQQDKLHPLRILIDHIHDAASKYFCPGEMQSLDEAMVAFKGRSSMRQHIAKKKSPTGFKVWMLVDSATNFVVHFDVYTGAKGKAKEENASANVVLNLVRRGLKRSHHTIVMDGFFTSVYLLGKLLELQQYAVGTTRVNRKLFPKELVQGPSMQRGEWRWRQLRAHREISIVSWMDKKPVNLISSRHDPTQQSSITRREGREQINVSCPPVLNLYTKHLRGVDVFSQRQSYNKIGRRSKKYFYSLIWFFMDVAIHNAFILYLRKHKPQHFAEKDFRKQLMQQLVDGFCSRRRASAAHKRARESLHQLAHTQTAGACKECRKAVGKGGNNKRSHFQCADCGIHLCVPDCYNKHVQALAQHTDNTDSE